MSEKKPQVPIERRELWRAHELAAMLGIGRETVYQLRRNEELPDPVKVGAAVAWRAQEIRDWLAAGCPERAHWQWKRTLPQKLDDLIKDRHRELREVDEELKRKRWELSRNQAVLNEADAEPG